MSIVTGGPNLYCACGVRTGSTKVIFGLKDILEWRAASAVGMHGEGFEEHNLNVLSSAVLFPYGFQTFHGHTKATPMNILVLKNYVVHVIVMRRNVLDSIVSLREWMNNEECKVTPGMYWPRELWSKMDDYEQYQYLAFNAVPWYMQFYRSWEDCDYPHLYVDYDDFYRDQFAGYERILDHFGLPYKRRIVKAVVGKEINKCVGVSGRGERLIPQEIVERIYEQAKLMGNPEGILDY